MAVLVVLAVFRGMGALGIQAFRSWRAAARAALAMMLCFTASAHFVPGLSEDLVRMVPPWVPNLQLMVQATGILEFLGACGLLIPRTQRLAGIALILFFVAVFPANVHAAQAGVTLLGEPATALWLRAPLQAFFIWLAWWSTKRGSPVPGTKGTA